MPKEEQNTPCNHQWDNWLKENIQKDKYINWHVNKLEREMNTKYSVTINRQMCYKITILDLQVISDLLYTFCPTAIDGINEILLPLSNFYVGVTSTFIFLLK